MEDNKELEKTIDSINKGIESMKEGLAKKADIETLEAKHAELTEKLDSVVGTEDFDKQQEHLDQISTDLKKLSEKGSKVEKNMYQIIEENLKSDSFQEAMNKPQNKGRLLNFNVKAASGDVTTADINSGDIRTQYEPGVAKHPWMQTPIWDSIPKGAIGEGRDSVSWWEQTSRVDGAEMVAENGAPSSQSSLEWTKQSMDIKNIAAYTKISRSALEDWEYTRSEVLDLLQNELPRKVETQIASGTGLTNYLTGIIGQAKSFSKPANFKTVASANYIDAARAIITQIMNGDTSDANKRGYMPNVLFVNPGDLMNLRGIKNADGSYIVPPFGDGLTQIDNVRLIPSFDLDADQFLMCDISKAKAYIKRNIQISFHYENEDDALKDLVTVVTRMRLAGAKIATPHKYGFVTGTWDAVKAAIETAVA